MTISPFQNLILNSLDAALTEGGWNNMELYFDQLTPLAILAQQAEETGKSVATVADETNTEMENPATTEDSNDGTVEEPIPTSMGKAFFKQEYEMYDDNGNKLN
jgi:hypothetical protein